MVYKSVDDMPPPRFCLHHKKKTNENDHEGTLKPGRPDGFSEWVENVAADLVKAFSCLGLRSNGDDMVASSAPQFTFE